MSLLTWIIPGAFITHLPFLRHTHKLTGGFAARQFQMEEVSKMADHDKTTIEDKIEGLKEASRRSVLGSAEQRLRMALDRGQRDERSIRPVDIYVACRAYCELYEEVFQNGEDG